MVCGHGHWPKLSSQAQGLRQYILMLEVGGPSSLQNV